MTLDVQDLSLTLGHKKLIKNISCSFQEGQLNGIIGINGAGKSMFLKSILGLQPIRGKVLYKGQHLDPSKYSYISQSNYIEANFTVFEIVLFGLYQDLVWKVQKDQAQKVMDILKDLHLEDIASRQFNTLSGGQQQMVLLAQALVKKPQLIFADEPTSALDIRNQLEYMTALKTYTLDNQATCLVVLHDLSLMCRYIDYFYLIEDGQLIKEGTKDQILEKQTLEDLYEVTMDISATKNGYQSILPINIK